MTKSQKLKFAERYRATLQRSLRPSLPAGAGRLLACSLGKTGASSGLVGTDLVGIHNQMIEVILSSHLSRAENGGDGVWPFLKGGSFLLEVLKPVEQATVQRLNRLEHQVCEGSAKLTALRHRMRGEVAGHWICKRQLAQSTRHYSQLLAQSRSLQEQSRQLARQILSAQEEERKEISRELHDEVAQILAGINVKLASLNESSAIGGRDLRRRILQTQRLVEQSVRVVHRYARELRPALLDDLGLIPALRSFINDLPRRRGLRIKFTAYAGVEALDNSQRTVLYRVAQEALTNVVRHARARIATVVIRRLRDKVCLEVHDNGRSFPAARILASTKLTRLGLLGMRERVEMIGGVFFVDSARGRGTTVRASIPFVGNPSKKRL